MSHREAASSPPGSMICFEPPVELEAVRAGRLPPRYGWRMQDFMLMHVLPLLGDGSTVLDIGSGRTPAIPPGLRPPNVRYVGLDIAAAELQAAPAGSYDETVVHDITLPLDLGFACDVVVSWQVLEHVSDLSNTVRHLRELITPGGRLVAQLTGTFSYFAIAARLVPHGLRVAAMARLLAAPEEEKFPTHYDRCWARALDEEFATWPSYQLYTFFRGAPYLNMARPLQRLYLAYEDVIARARVRNLATHYLLVAQA